MDALFIVGSSLFALGALPGFANLVAPNTVVATFFIGSLFFTSAAALQLHLAGGGQWTIRPSDLGWAAAAIQLVGTLWFNVNTFAARQTGLDARQEDLRVWTPDVVGSICFLVASGLALAALGGRPWPRGPARVAGLNMAGSVFFMAAALAAYVLPDTGDMLDASVVNGGTVLGALCFLVAARMEITRAG
jgi:hypothetical protein